MEKDRCSWRWLLVKHHENEVGQREIENTVLIEILLYDHNINPSIIIFLVATHTNKTSPAERRKSKIASHYFKLNTAKDAS